MVLASAALEALPDIPALRRVRPELMHVTLAFLGAVAAERLEDVAAAVGDGVARRRACLVSFDSLGRFPLTVAPTVAWLWVGPVPTDVTTTAAALAQYDLAPEERAMFQTGTARAERLEDRMSKSDLSAAMGVKTSTPTLKSPSQTAKKR